MNYNYYMNYGTDTLILADTEIVEIDYKVYNRILFDYNNNLKIFPEITIDPYKEALDWILNKVFIW
eukprot:CAMPEP_0116958360 /NCGR_PEP_ID=MMETSP0467-20121206/44589_1 /TAXON_ID=283647 /ORGANISM="Mesodinium pulex, Strain SPMC105" /LENGTH=65 /DNA_ID=CAMNT_0004645423 /DNA_START=330 /DNA_END=524 /DNA_ORIENTATION=+